jgi:hypothetical protein
MQKITHEANRASKLSREVNSCLSDVAAEVAKLQISNKIIQDKTFAILAATSASEERAT